MLGHRGWEVNDLSKGALGIALQLEHQQVRDEAETSTRLGVAIAFQGFAAAKR
jgi:hypothetical protein